MLINIQKSYIIFLGFVLVFGCSLYSCSKIGGKSEKGIVYQIPDNITIEKLTLDTVMLDMPEGSSGLGFFRFVNDSVFYFDNVTHQVYAYDTSGKYHGLRLKNGNGPNEIPSFQEYLFSGNKHLLFNGWTVFVYNTNWQIEQTRVIDFDLKHSTSELLANPNPEYQGIYQVKYYENQWSTLESNQLIFNIETNHPKYNAYISAGYYATSRIFGQLDLESAKVVRIFGNKSPKYKDYRFIPHFDFHKYHYVGENFYINHEPDELIYVYDKMFDFQYAFGRPGKNMNQNYRQTNSLDDEIIYNRDRFLFDRLHYGYYSDIFYVREGDLLFRSYTTGTNEENAKSNRRRLQIYQDKTLIGDVEVPPGFKILKFDPPYYYAQGVEGESDDKMGFFRFRL